MTGRVRLIKDNIEIVIAIANGVGNDEKVYYCRI